MTHKRNFPIFNPSKSKFSSIQYKTTKGSVVLDHLDNTIFLNGKEVFREKDRREEWGAREKDRRYGGVYKDFLKRVSSRTSNVDDALGDMLLIAKAYELGNKNHKGEKI